MAVHRNRVLGTSGTLSHPLNGKWNLETRVAFRTASWPLAVSYSVKVGRNADLLFRHQHGLQCIRSEERQDASEQ